MKTTAKIDRNMNIYEMRKNGSTFESIANANSISRERVRQIICNIDRVKEVLSKFHIKIDPSTPVDELYFTVRIWNCLHNAGIENIGQLISLTEKDVLKIKNFGRKSLEELKGELGEYNLFLSKERCPVCGKEIDESPSCG